MPNHKNQECHFTVVGKVKCPIVRLPGYMVARLQFNVPSTGSSYMLVSGQ